MKKLIATTALALALAGCQTTTTPYESTSGYVCKPTAFGYCTTEYTGPVTAGAAAEYAADSREALAWVVNTYPSIDSAFYEPRQRLLVLRFARGFAPDRGEARNILDHFNEMALVVDIAKLQTAGGGAAGKPVTNDLKENGAGKARFNALRGYKVDEQALAYSAFTTSSALSSDVFQNDTDSDVTKIQRNLPELPVGMRSNATGN